MTIEQAFSLAISLVAFFGGIWVRRIAEDTNKLEKEIAEIKRIYQQKSESQRDYAVLKEFLQDMKQQISRIETKIDKKADK